MCTSWNGLCLGWRLWIRPTIILLYALFVIIVLPLLILNTVKDGFTKKDQLILIGGLLVFTTIPICIWHIMQHIYHFTKPILQKPIIRILWMVPIYALNAWFGLIYPQHSFYLNSMRECYEAYVIYNFMKYLLNFLNLEMDLEASMEYKPPVKHIFPLCCMQPWEMGREFVHNCKHGILQYTVIRPIITFISVICELNGVYGEGSFSGDVAFPYIVAINNVSQFVAMYCLVLFYQANKDELRPMKPLPKFLCIKAVVFFSFFQGVLINFFVYFGYIKNIFGSGVDNDYRILSSKLQNFLICIEMFIAAIAHKYSFPHDPYHINIPDYNTDRTWLNALAAMWDLSDVGQDVSDHLGVVGSSLTRRLRGRSSYQYTRSTSETDYLINANPGSLAVPQSFYQSGAGNGQQHHQHQQQPSGSNASTATLHSGKNRYGAFDTSAASVYNKNGAITIVKQNMPAKEYSPQYGVPRTDGNYFFNYDQPSPSPPSLRQEQSSRSDNTSRSESAAFDCGATGGGGIGGGNRGGRTMKKSDSTASDWLSTPTDELMGIDVRGIEKDRINYKNNPRI